MAAGRNRRRFSATADAVPELCEFALEEASKLGFSAGKRDRLRLALEEAAVNVCRYAYGGNSGEMHITVEAEGDSVVVELSDRGVPFDPLSVQKPDVARSIREGRAGGFGIHLMKCMAEEVAYRREGGRNLLRLTFKKAEGDDDDPG